MQQPISFLSDFGSADEFVGVVHGVIARIAPGARVIDVTHGIARGNVRAGSLALLRAVQYLPNGVVLGIVDPGVGTARKAIAVETPWGLFVGPDNGLLAPAVAMVGGALRAVSLEAPAFRLPAAGDTFAGRDVFAPAAAVLASGEAAIGDLGPELPTEDLAPLLLPLPAVEGDSIVGEIMWEDRFGNLQTNVAPADMAAAGLSVGATIVVEVGATAHEVPWVGAYGEVPEGDVLIHVDSSGQMSLAVRNGSAAHSLKLAEGMAVTVRRSPATPK